MISERRWRSKWPDCRCGHCSKQCCFISTSPIASLNETWEFLEFSRLNWTRPYTALQTFYILQYDWAVKFCKVWNNWPILIYCICQRAVSRCWPTTSSYKHQFCIKSFDRWKFQKNPKYLPHGIVLVAKDNLLPPGSKMFIKCGTFYRRMPQLQGRRPPSLFSSANDWMLYRRIRKYKLLVLSSWQQGPSGLMSWVHPLSCV